MNAPWLSIMSNVAHLQSIAAAADTVQPNKPHKDLPKDAGEHTIARLDMMRNSKGNLHTSEIRRNMQRIMQVGHTSRLPVQTPD